jgi:hypothetical protein
LAATIRSGMIGDTKTDIRNLLSWGAAMSISNVLEFDQADRPMTYEQAFAFIEKMRRQLDRFGVAVPGKNGQRMNPETEAQIRSLCDELEAEFRSDLGTI